MQVIPDHPVNTYLNLLRGPAELSTTAAGVESGSYSGHVRKLVLERVSGAAEKQNY
jgi:hypothetical protein